MPVSCPGKQAIFVQLCYTVNSVETNLSVCKKRILRKYSLNRMREEPGIKKKTRINGWYSFICVMALLAFLEMEQFLLFPL